MLTRVQALNFRSLRHIDQKLEPFHVLVGPNASGKTTFLDAIGFLSDLVSKGLDEAISARTSNFQDLVWGREGDRFELAVEAEIPEERRLEMPEEHQKYTIARYEVSIRFNDETNETAIYSELFLLKVNNIGVRNPADVQLHAPASVLTSADDYLDENYLFIVQKQPLLIIEDTNGVKQLRRGYDSIEPETIIYRQYTFNRTTRWINQSFYIGSQRSTLATVPDDESMFPVTTWFKQLLTEGVQPIVMNGLTLRQASPPGQGLNFKADASNLPWVVDNLKKKAPERFESWIAHLKTSLPDLEDIRVVRREDDRHMYLMVRYESGVEVPSWMVSDGTLRLFALTLPAYVSDFNGIYLIEEPENGIHPRAIETMFQSLSSVYDAQILMATHSPIVLGIVDAAQVLCFSKDEEGATHIVRGDEHPALQNWHGETNLGTLFAAGVLS